MLLNRAKANTATTGTGAVTPGSAVPPYNTWSAAGAISGAAYDYLIEDGNAWELGTGIYNGTTITRPGPGVDANFASSSGSLLVLSGAATVGCVANWRTATSPMEAPYIQPPAASNWTNENFYAATSKIDITPGVDGPLPGVRFKHEATALIGNTNNTVMLLRPIVGTHWRITAKLQFLGMHSLYNTFGLVVRESSTAKSMTLGWASEYNALGWQRLNNDASYNSAGGFMQQNRLFDVNNCWFRLVNDGTNAYLYFSRDGFHWIEVWHNGGTTWGFLTTAATHYGVALGLNDSGINNGNPYRHLDIVSWLEETLP